MNQTVKVHYCFKQHLGQQLNPNNCHCREWITFQEAEQKITDGLADWMILSRTKVTPEDTAKRNLDRGRFNPPQDNRDRVNFLRACPMCAKFSEARKAHCKNCHGRGQEPQEVYWEELSRYQNPEPGGSIVMIGWADDKGRFNLPLHKKTPRVATLEGPNPNSGPQRLGHIVRAAVMGKEYDRDRIEEYGRINKLELFGKPQGKPLNEKTNIKGNKIILPIEPEDKPGGRKQDAQGRRYDYGRTIVW